jgi:hypothetical protein
MNRVEATNDNYQEYNGDTDKNVTYVAYTSESTDEDDVKDDSTSEKM